MRGSVEETLNELLEAEAEKLTQAARYERNEPVSYTHLDVYKRQGQTGGVRSYLPGDAENARYRLGDRRSGKTSGSENRPSSSIC